MLDFVIQEPKHAPDKPETKKVDPSRKAVIHERTSAQKAPTKDDVAAAFAEADAWEARRAANAAAAKAKAGAVPGAKVEEVPAKPKKK
jgi:hypothetical protein